MNKLDLLLKAVQLVGERKASRQLDKIDTEAMKKTASKALARGKKRCPVCHFIGHTPKHFVKIGDLLQLIFLGVVIISFTAKFMEKILVFHEEYR